jgi:hypothetical protein
MATITNHTTKAITLPTMHVIPAKGSLTTTNEVLRDNDAMLGGLARSLQITVDYDPEQLPDEPPGKVSFEPNPAAVEQAAVDRALAEAKAKEVADQLAARQAAEAAAEDQSASKPAAAKK